MELDFGLSSLLQGFSSETLTGTSMETYDTYDFSPDNPLYNIFPSKLKNLSSLSTNALNQVFTTAFSTYTEFVKYYSLLYSKWYSGKIETFNLLKDIIYLETNAFSQKAGFPLKNVPFYYIFFPNPHSVRISHSSPTTMMRSRSWVYPNFSGSEDKLDIEGHFAALFCPLQPAGLVRTMRQTSFGYWEHYILRAIYLSNSWQFRKPRSTYYTIPDYGADVRLYLRDKVYYGYFTHFTESEAARDPFLIPFNFSFNVYSCRRLPPMFHFFQLLSGLPVLSFASSLSGALSTPLGTPSLSSGLSEPALIGRAT